MEVNKLGKKSRPTEISLDFVIIHLSIIPWKQLIPPALASFCFTAFHCRGKQSKQGWEKSNNEWGRNESSAQCITPPGPGWAFCILEFYITLPLLEIPFRKLEIGNTSGPTMRPARPGLGPFCFLVARLFCP